MEALGINLGFLIVQIIAFIIVFLTLQAWIYKPLLNMLDTRRKKITQGLEDARIAAEARADAEKDAAKILSDAQVQGGKVVRDATERATVAGQEVRAASENEAARIREVAVTEAETERNRILGDLRGQVAALAIAAAQKLIGEALDDKRQRGLIDEFFSGVKSGKVTVLDQVDFKGESAEITSALPLTPSEQETVKGNILAKVGAQAVMFRVDPAILGGLIIKVGDRIVDASVSGRLDGLRQNMK